MQSPYFDFILLKTMKGFLQETLFRSPNRFPKKLLSCHPGQVDLISFWANAFSFLLTQQARDQASCLPTELLKKQTKICPGQAIFEGYLS